MRLHRSTAAVAATALTAAPWLFGSVVRAQTTASVYLPGYEPGDWSALRGSIITSDASKTTYTIFCAEESALSCSVSGGVPFVIAEGPDTLEYSGSLAGKITADLDCSLAGTTAATCTGSTTLGSGFTEGTFKGPTETSWTKTFTGSQVVWAPLTLTTPPSTTAAASTEASSGDGASTTRHEPSVTLSASQSVVSGTTVKSMGMRGPVAGGWEGCQAVVGAVAVVLLGLWLR